jgi:hypothetical protein
MVVYGFGWGLDFDLIQQAAYGLVVLEDYPSMKLY